MYSFQRLRIAIQGVVQGVGFRPFIFKLATELKLAGWVLNSSQGVFIEVEGEKDTLKRFLLRVQSEKPAHSYFQSFEASYLDKVGYSDFEIRKSQDSGEKTVLVLPDIATCPECLAETLDPHNRRFNYPFTNCTLCGPRYSIIESLPYDRPNTSMKHFEMCPTCLSEYQNPLDRRFHAQPNCCPACGPVVSLWDSNGKELATGVSSFDRVTEGLKTGKIVALKGIGGFHLMANASDKEAIEKLRFRKRRSEKPLAVMMSSIDQVRQECAVDDFEARLLLSSESPIVLLDRNTQFQNSAIDSSVAPDNPTLGVLLPYSPLHHILMSRLDFPVVATSGNLSNEPICIDENEAINRLKGIADLFLVHNRPIVRSVDDSVVRIVKERELVYRRSRGYVPLPIQLKKSTPPALAVGAHQKNSVGFQIGQNAFISQHIGDLETEESYSAFLETISSFEKLFDVSPDCVICDEHPEYLSTKFAEELNIPSIKVQHHYAHVASCMAENQLEGNVLGISWDGTGFGKDETIWGGEFLHFNLDQVARILKFHSFCLPGATQAIKEPRRSALGVLYETFGDEIFEMDQLKTIQAYTKSELKLIRQMMKSGFNSPKTTSVGRLFDAVASITGIRQSVSFEGQGAMELEFQTNDLSGKDFYPFEIGEVIDWRPMIRELVNDVCRGENLHKIATKFHNFLVEVILEVAERVQEPRVVLSGGCFQNKFLLERSIDRLTEKKFVPYWHQRVPPNDGGICLGQLYLKANNIKDEY